MASRARAVGPSPIAAAGQSGRPGAYGIPPAWLEHFLRWLKDKACPPFGKSVRRQTNQRAVELLAKLVENSGQEIGCGIFHRPVVALYGIGHGVEHICVKQAEVASHFVARRIANMQLFGVIEPLDSIAQHDLYILCEYF